MSAITITKLKKYFGQIQALDNVSFSVDSGEIFGFLGPNGAGKTTAIRCLMNYISPLSGKVSILGQDAQACSTELKKQVGYISSEDTLFENWTGQEHIDLSHSLYGDINDTEKLIRLFEFDPKRKVKDLSTGNKRKLAIILALMHKPKILIADEPTTGLDPILQNRFYDSIRELNAAGSTIFMSSHNLAEVEKVCSRVAVIKAGKLMAVENISSLKSKKIYMVDVLFAEKFDLSDFDDKNIEIVNQNNRQLVIKAKIDINTIIAKLKKYKLKSLQISHASLEDIFLEFYERK